jgi:hypothetical protein
VALENGAVFLGKRTRTTPAVAISLAMRAGSICDPDDAAGATWLLSRVIDRGTTTRSALDIADELDNRGISLNFAVTRHILCRLHVPRGRLRPVFRSPPKCSCIRRFLKTKSRRAKGEVVAIRQDEDNPAVRATESLMALGPDGHPHGRRTMEQLKLPRASRDRLLQLHADRFAPASHGGHRR